ncbi:class D sortase [Enterococcus sp. BWT-B8]|uniref:class D sortase n=1 Tax=unclassified Enterococcus TaxID=2608891 RepID=UPI001E5ED032|nr:class D sortase [Enterococcus sp. BWT-B8]MCB5951731.1 class D sortase [Enterococcus sp. BWT-B8]
MPFLFMIFGYLIIYIIGAPVINFASSAVELILLSDAPDFESEKNNLFAEAEQTEKEQSINSEGKLASSTLIYPDGGDQFGKVIIDKVGINEPLFYGDSEDILSLGAGQYIGSMIPGDIGTTLIGGHNAPSFGKIYYLEPGDSISISTHYGDYTYQVTEKKIAHYTDPVIKERLGDKTKHSLILYTCYPLDAIGLTPERVFVFADYVSGPLIDGDV